MTCVTTLRRISFHPVVVTTVLLRCIHELAQCQVLECYNDELYSADRHIFLDFHNEARQRVANGLEPDGLGGLLPPASNMYKLRWSCLLENEMHERLIKCPVKFPPLNGFGQNVMTVYEHKGTLIAPLKEIRETLKDWWSEFDASEEETGPMLKYTNEDIHNFANMVFANNTEIGCSYASCEDDERILIGCLYRKDGAIMDQILYASGQPCNTDFDCSTYKNSKCTQQGMCVKERFRT